MKMKFKPYTSLVSKCMLLSVLIALTMTCSDSEDPDDESILLFSRSFVDVGFYNQLRDNTAIGGGQFAINHLSAEPGGNRFEVGGYFQGGCGEHFLTLVAEDDYIDQASQDIPLDISIYLLRQTRFDSCMQVNQNVRLRNMDLSFLAQGRYNITLINASDRAEYLLSNYEIR